MSDGWIRLKEGGRGVPWIFVHPCISLSIPSILEVYATFLCLCSPAPRLPTLARTSDMSICSARVRKMVPAGCRIGGPHKWRPHCFFIIIFQFYCFSSVLGLLSYFFLQMYYYVFCVFNWFYYYLPQFISSIWMLVESNLMLYWSR